MNDNSVPSMACLHFPGIKDLVHTDNVFLFVPNIIDYVRLLMILLFGYHAMIGNYVTASICYVINFALDELDGNSARYLGQTSIFGMMLDIYLDEASVVFLGMALCTLYPQYIILFQLYSAIDFCAQWSNYQYSALYRQNNYTSTDDWLLKKYFNNYVLMLFWVYGNHIFLLMLYLQYYSTGPILSFLGVSVGLWKIVAILSAPWSVSRLCIMVYLLITSMYNLGKQDQLKRIQSRTEVERISANEMPTMDIIGQSEPVCVNTKADDVIVNKMESSNVHNDTNSWLILEKQLTNRVKLKPGLTVLAYSGIHAWTGVDEDMRARRFHNDRA